MINSKIMQFEQTIMKVVEMSCNEGVPEAALYLALMNATSKVAELMNQRIQEEYANSAQQVGEPVVEDLHPDNTDE